MASQVPWDHRCCPLWVRLNRLPDAGWPSQRKPLRHCTIVGEGWAGPPKPSIRRDHS
jgi:hypothetical protein